jgi:tripartite-type tricarboxylate transporter receptor subunit TctC
MPSRRLRWSALLAATAFLALASRPSAAFPDRIITFIVPFAAGGSTDVVARILGEHMSRTLGQQIVIETVVGAGGTVGTARAAKAPADGHTVVVGSLGPNVAAVGMYGSLPYDPVKDFEPVIMSVLQPMVVIARKTLPVKDFRQFVGYLKSDGAKLNYGSGGIGAQSHLTCAYLNELVGSRSQHVPFRGSAPALTALIAGQIDYACNNTTEAVPQIQANAVMPLAIAGDRKVPVLPEVPTAAEQGLTFEAMGWQALFVPRGTPREPGSRRSSAACKVNVPVFDHGAPAVLEQRMKRAAPQILRLEFLDKLLHLGGITPGLDVDVARRPFHRRVVTGKAGDAAWAVFDRNPGAHVFDIEIDLTRNSCQHHRDVGCEGGSKKPAWRWPGIGSAGAANESWRLVRDQRVATLDGDGAASSALKHGFGPVLPDFGIVFEPKSGRHVARP